jgi:hypothetical protein
MKILTLILLLITSAAKSADVWVSITGTAEFPSSAVPGTVVHNNKLWLIGGTPNYQAWVWNSTDGVSWNSVTKNAEFANVVTNCCLWNPTRNTNPHVC